MADPTTASAVTSAWEFKDYLGAAGFGLSLLLALVKVWEIYSARKDRSRDQQAGVDDTWFKTVVLDSAIPALREFLDGQRSALKNAGALGPGAVRPHAAVLRTYLRESEDLKSRLKPIEELSTNAYEIIVRAIESLDDRISPYCAHADDAGYDRVLVADEWVTIRRQGDQCFRECMSVLRKVHYALRRARDPDREIPRPLN